MFITIALITFFALTALKDFAVAIKYIDLLRGVSAVAIVICLIFGQGL